MGVLIKQINPTSPAPAGFSKGSLTHIHKICTDSTMCRTRLFLRGNYIRNLTLLFLIALIEPGFAGEDNNVLIDRMKQLYSAAYSDHTTLTLMINNEFEKYVTKNDVKHHEAEFVLRKAFNRQTGQITTLNEKEVSDIQEKLSDIDESSSERRNFIVENPETDSQTTNCNPKGLNVIVFQIIISGNKEEIFLFDSSLISTREFPSSRTSPSIGGCELNTISKSLINKIYPDTFLFHKTKILNYLLTSDAVLLRYYGKNISYDIFKDNMLLDGAEIQIGVSDNGSLAHLRCISSRDDYSSEELSPSVEFKNALNISYNTAKKSLKHVRRKKQMFSLEEPIPQKAFLRLIKYPSPKHIIDSEMDSYYLKSESHGKFTLVYEFLYKINERDGTYAIEVFVNAKNGQSFYTYSSTNTHDGEKYVWEFDEHGQIISWPEGVKNE